MMSPAPAVTVVIPSFNTPEEFLRKCLESLLRQTMADWVAIVVDDASTRGDPGRVVSQLGDGRIRVIRHTENRGEAGARNTGVRASHTQLLASLDPDDWFESTYLEETTRALGEHPEADWVLTDWYVASGKGQEIWRFPDPLPPLCPSHFNAGSPGLIRRRVWETTGGYAEDAVFRAGGADLDFWLGAVERGFRPVHVPRPLYGYRRHADMASVATFPEHHHLIHEALYRRHKQFFDSFDELCPRCPRNRVGEYLASGYFSSSEAALSTGRRLRAIRLAIRGFSLHPGSTQSARRLVRTLLPEPVIATARRWRRGPHHAT